MPVSRREELFRLMARWWRCCWFAKWRCGGCKRSVWCLSFYASGAVRLRLLASDVKADVVRVEAGAELVSRELDASAVSAEATLLVVCAES
ncbi:MAG: hypothetical protein ACKERG_03705 [Candidatus Hodgkinia cicadicola]